MKRSISFLLLVLLMVPLGAASALSVGDAREPDLVMETAETWRLVSSSQQGAAYEAIRGRPLQAVTVLRSDHPASDVYLMMPAPATGRRVGAARFLLLSRSGVYSGNATLALEVRTLDGDLRRVVTAQPLDLQLQPAGDWLELQLSSSAAERAIQSGEYLAFHLNLDGGPEGDLLVEAAVEVEVFATPISTVYLPLVVSD